jgi:ABC-type transport system involved in cytochrome c biogenesis permease subunit
MTNRTSGPDASRFVPWVVVGLATVYLLVAMAPMSQAEGDMRLSDAATLPVLDGGRVKPLDTYARNQMLVISKRQDYTDGLGKTQPAVRWMLDTLAMGLAIDYAYVPIEDEELIKALGLPPNNLGRYPIDAVEASPKWAELKKKLPPLDRLTPADLRQMPRLEANAVLLAIYLNEAHRTHRPEIAAAIRTKLADRQVGKAAVLRIENDQLLDMLGLQGRSGFRYTLDEVENAPRFAQFRMRANKLRAERAAKLKSNTPFEPDLLDAKVLELAEHLGVVNGLLALEGPRMVPPPEAASPGAEWLTLADALHRAEVGVTTPEQQSWETMLRCYGLGDGAGFNKALDEYTARLDKRSSPDVKPAPFEAFFNNFQPFYQCMVLYVVAFVLLAVSWLNWTETLRRSAYWLAALALVVHTWALISRMIMQGRPPVTNLYSSAVFIGWGCVLLCLVLERWLSMNGLATLAGTILAVPTLLIAHHLATSGDTLEMMQAVLDTNFWLATHVVCVTLGYTATFLAGVFGIIYVVSGLLTTSLAPGQPGGDGGRRLGQLIYGTACFATLLSFVGTVLGGIWADQSWGRFWGWDPKENGALLIVLMNALILHARWGGMVKDRGMALLAICGNIVTFWSWFGTNQLGIGLHAYGFNKTLVMICSCFWMSQILLLGAGLMPLAYWRSFGEAPLLRPTPPQLSPVTGPMPAPTPTPVTEQPRKGKARGRRGSHGIKR